MRVVQASAAILMLLSSAAQAQTTGQVVKIDEPAGMITIKGAEETQPLTSQRTVFSSMR
jgi:hypothetical protein